MLRDTVIPTMHAFDPNLVEGLTTLSKKMAVYHSMYVKSILRWLKTHVIQKQNYSYTLRTHKRNVCVETETYYCIPYDDFTNQMEFWDIFFKHFHIQCSTKSKQLLFDTIQAKNLHRRITLSSTLNAFLDSHIHIFTTS